MTKHADGVRPGDGGVDDLAASLIGLSWPEAERRAFRRGCRVVDRTEPGWDTAEQDPRRIRVVVRESRVVEAVVG